jgi:hypothetical protein
MRARNPPLIKRGSDFFFRDGVTAAMAGFEMAEIKPMADCHAIIKNKAIPFPEALFRRDGFEVF